MSEVALNGTALTAPATGSRASALRRLRTGDMLFRNLTRVAVFAVLGLLSGVI